MSSSEASRRRRAQPVNRRSTNRATELAVEGAHDRALSGGLTVPGGSQTPVLIAREHCGSFRSPKLAAFKGVMVTAIDSRRAQLDELGAARRGPE